MIIECKAKIDLDRGEIIFIDGDYGLSIWVDEYKGLRRNVEEFIFIKEKGLQNGDKFFRKEVVK